MDEEVYLTSAQVLDLLKITAKTLYRLIHKGQIPFIRVGQQYRFRESEIRAWVKATSRATGRTPGGSPEAQTHPRALVVDDEEAVRDLVARALVRGGYEADTAADGVEALTRLQEHPYDLLITDLRMPGLDGLTMIREARRRSSSLAVVIMTAYSTEQSAIEAINLGVVGYLLKPFRSGHVLTAANRAIGAPAPATL